MSTKSTAVGCLLSALLAIALVFYGVAFLASANNLHVQGMVLDGMNRVYGGVV